MHARVAAPLCCAVLAALVAPVRAQTGGLEVTVEAAESGEPLVGATVELSSTLGNVARTAVLADAGGRALSSRPSNCRWNEREAPL